MNIKLDTLLFSVLVSFFILTYGLAPRSTPYWLFGLIFASIIAYGVLDVINVKKKVYELSKNIILWALILVVILSAAFSEISLRRETVSTFRVHDIVIQQEVAIRMLLVGRNPYSTSYFGSPLEQWHYSDKEKNPALYHFVMEPFYLLFAIPFYVASGRLMGFFDGRLPLIFLFIAMLFVVQKITLEGEKKRSYLALLAFNPLTLPYLIEGRSDFFMFAFLLAGILFLHKRKLYLSVVLVALAFAIKQSAWPIFPFYFFYIYFKHKDKFVRALGLFSAILAAIILPFFLWNPKAFIESTVFYLSGNVAHSYPISGYGFSMVLNQFGIIKNIHDQFPFFIFQLVIALPVLIYLIRIFRKNLTVKTMLLFYTIFLFVFWYFARYFNNSHIAYILSVMTSAYFWPEKDA